MTNIKSLQIALVLLAFVLGFSQPVVNGLTLLSCIMLASVAIIGHHYRGTVEADNS